MYRVRVSHHRYPGNTTELQSELRERTLFLFPKNIPKGENYWKGLVGMEFTLPSSAPLRIAVGRLRTTPLLHIGAYIHRRRARPRPLSRTPEAWGVVVAGGPVGRTRFGLGVVALTAASSPLALSDSESSESCVRVGPPATG